MTLLHSPSQPTNDETIDLRRYIAVINQAKWRILLLATLITIFAIIIALNMRAIYSSRATLLIEAQQAKAVKIEEVYGMNSAQQEYYLTQFEILKSRSIAETVIDKLGLASHPEFQGPPSLLDKLKIQLPFLSMGNSGTDPQRERASEREKLIDAFTDRLSIEPVRKTQLVNISFEAFDPELAAQVANAVGDAYIDSQLEAKMGITQKANAWLGGRLGELRLKLDESEKALQEFRVREGLIDVSGVRSLGSQELERLGQEITQARAKKAQIDSFVRVVNQYGANNIERLESLPEITTHAGIQGVKMELVQAERKVSELSKTFGPKHPKLIAVKSELATVQDNLRSQIKQLVEGMKDEADTVSQNLAALEAEMNKSKGLYQDLSGKEAEYQRLQREVETNRQLFDTFMARQKETEVASDFNSAIARFTDRAMPSSEPVKPKRRVIVLVAFVSALLFGVVIAFVQDSLNDTIKTTQDIELQLQQRALGMVPHIPGKIALAEINKLFFASEQRQFSESIRSIRTSVSLLGIERPIQVMAVTSSVPEEGKSTVSCNMAFAMSQLDKVLIIDADMRKPTVAKRFALPAFQVGLANYLAGTEDLNDCIVTDEQSGVDIMAAGTIPLNPLELLSSPRLQELLTLLRGRYQRIIIDTPPVQAVSDALVISQFVDAVLMVVKADQTRSGLVKHSLSSLINAHARVLGVVLNDLDLSKAEKYYGGYGYYQYYAEKDPS